MKEKGNKERRNRGEEGRKKERENGTKTEGHADGLK